MTTDAADAPLRPVPLRPGLPGPGREPRHPGPRSAESPC